MRLKKLTKWGKRRGVGNGNKENRFFPNFQCLCNAFFFGGGGKNRSIFDYAERKIHLFWTPTRIQKDPLTTILTYITWKGIIHQSEPFQFFYWLCMFTPLQFSYAITPLITYFFLILLQNTNESLETFKINWNRNKMFEVNVKVKWPQLNDLPVIVLLIKWRKTFERLEYTLNISDLKT